MPDMDREIESLIASYMNINSLRSEILFRHFLPTGYSHTTLDSVSTRLFQNVIYAKVHLGMIITLYDDFADHPKYRNSQLLSYLYQLNVGIDKATPSLLVGQDRNNYELARTLFLSLTKVLETFPHYHILLPALRFDIEQFYSCNRHSELMTLIPSIRNLTESRTLGPHNMGIVAAGTIDLMASPDMDLAELGTCRETFHLGQRLGRTSNLIFTLQREFNEGDLTNEILISTLTKKTNRNDYQTQLLREFSLCLDQIRIQTISSFNSSRYAHGFVSLHGLHASLVGKI